MPSPSLGGQLSEAVRRLIMKPAAVASVDAIGNAFRLVTLQGDALRDVDWLPGQKVQIATGRAFETRTYTPIDWDAALGRFRFLGYVPGNGPGSWWLVSARPGVSCEVFGPRGSIDSRDLGEPVALFGDETSLGLAIALLKFHAVRPLTSHFEVLDLGAVGEVVAHIGLSGARLHARQVDGSLPGSMVSALSTLIAEGYSFVLTGRAEMIQHVRQALRSQRVSASRIKSKAYWAPGKKGLD